MWCCVWVLYMRPLVRRSLSWISRLSMSLYLLAFKNENHVTPIINQVMMVTVGPVLSYVTTFIKKIIIWTTSSGISYVVFRRRKTIWPFSQSEHRRSWHGLTTPLFSNFLFANLFSIKFLYFFIISSLFPYFNLFVSIFIHSIVNIKLHVSTIYRY
jgi:hypothetical protein